MGTKTHNAVAFFKVSHVVAYGFHHAGKLGTGYKRALRFGLIQALY